MRGSRATPRYGSREHYLGRAPSANGSAPDEAPTALDTVTPPDDGSLDSSEWSLEDGERTEVDGAPPRLERLEERHPPIFVALSFAAAVGIALGALFGTVLALLA